MSPQTRPPSWYPELWSTDPASRNSAYKTALAETATPVAWADQVWDDTVGHLTDDDNHHRSIAAQLLNHLAISAPQRVDTTLPALIEVTRDARFVTARHCLQSLWRIALAGPEARKAVIAALAARFSDCDGEKNDTLIRADIIEALARVHEHQPDDDLEHLAQQLIVTEPDPGYQKKYRRLWRARAGSPDRQ